VCRDVPGVQQGGGQRGAATDVAPSGCMIAAAGEGLGFHRGCQQEDGAARGWAGGKGRELVKGGSE
jgi:hypothetical protein